MRRSFREPEKSLQSDVKKNVKKLDMKREMNRQTATVTRRISPQEPEAGSPFYSISTFHNGSPPSE